MGNCCQKSTPPARLGSMRSYEYYVDVSFENGQANIKPKRRSDLAPLKSAVGTPVTTSQNMENTNTTLINDDDTVLKKKILECLIQGLRCGKRQHQQTLAPSKEEEAPSSAVAETSTSIVKASSTLNILQLLDLSEQLGMLVKEPGRIHDLISVLADSRWSPLAYFLFRHKEAHKLFVDTLEMEADVTVDTKEGNTELVTRVFSQWQRLLPQIEAAVQDGGALGESPAPKT